jgi:probable rRNA maturation factor
VSTELNNESGMDVDELVLVRLARFVLDAMHINPLAELSIVLLDPDAMAALHQQWMNMSGPTDVMAFPMDAADGPLERLDPSAPPATGPDPGEAMLGDVVLCPQVAAEQAVGAGHSAEAELHLLCTHGILHLLGFDHGDVEEEREMFQLQARLLADWATASGLGPIHAPLPGTGGPARDAAGGRRG